MRLIFAAFTVFLFASQVTAQVVTDCERWQANLRNLAEPWEENTRQFANGAVRISVIDTLEPAVAAFHLAILSPPYSELGDRQCRRVSVDDSGVGFSGVIFNEMTAGYDPATGLGLDLPIILYMPQTADFQRVGLGLTINQATGEIGTKIYPVD